MSRNLDEIDPTFLNDLRHSREAVRVVADWLSAQGYPVVVRPTFERPDPSQRTDYADSGDLEIMQRVEVKRRQGLTFTSREDFPYETLIVDVCHSYDNARPKPYSYVILNREMTAAFIVDCRATYPYWKKVTKRDKGRDRDFYECPLKLVRFKHIQSEAA